ncbi:hypothetical protein PG996_002927 [Apiospora saccharicola]|uniref:Uncharacterized protein n=1 Tax=Apiospora saccharicola TaxID=335842 RepID=A0ABR1WKT1_9PEZI
MWHRVTHSTNPDIILAWASLEHPEFRPYFQEAQVPPASGVRVSAFVILQSAGTGTGGTTALDGARQQLVLVQDAGGPCSCLDTRRTNGSGLADSMVGSSRKSINRQKRRRYIWCDGGSSMVRLGPLNADLSSANSNKSSPVTIGRFLYHRHH